MEGKSLKIKKTEKITSNIKIDVSLHIQAQYQQNKWKITTIKEEDTDSWKINIKTKNYWSIIDFPAKLKKKKA